VSIVEELWRDEIRSDDLGPWRAGGFPAAREIEGKELVDIPAGGSALEIECALVDCGIGR